MILAAIEKLLQRRLDKKKQEVIRLRWKRAQLQQKLDQVRRQREK